MAFIVIFVLLNLMASTELAGAVQSVELGVNIESLSSRVYSSRHGLPSNGVECVFTDRYGFIWICTQEGVARYDGQDFLVYSDFPDEIGKHVVSYAIDNQDRFWFGTMRGLALLDESGFTQIILPSNLNRKIINSMVTDRQGDIWLICNWQGPYKVDSETLTIRENSPGLPDLSINDMTSDTEGTIWLATSGGIYKKSDETYTMFPVPGYENAVIESLMMDSASSGWLTTQKGKIVRFSRTGTREVDLFGGDEQVTVLGLAQSHKQGIWLGTDRGLFLWEADRLDRFTVTNGLATNIINSVIIDREGLLWYGSDNGLGKVSGIMFRQLLPSEKLPVSAVSDLELGPDGTFWIGTNVGIIQLKSRSVKTWTTADGLDSNYIMALVLAPDGGVFVANSRTLFRLKSGKLTRVVPKKFESIMDLTIGPDGNIWITDIHGIYQLDSSNIELKSGSIGIPDAVDLTTIHFDRSGKLWILTDGAGVYYGKQDDLMSMKAIDNLPSKYVYSICDGKTDEIWLGTSRGACEVINDKVRFVFSQKQGMASESVWTVYKDPNDNMWFSTSRGLSYLENGRIHNFDVEDGLSSDDLVTNVVLTAPDGRIWFGGTGLTIVDPDFDTMKIAPRTFIKSALINGKTLESNAQIPNGNNTIEFVLLCQSYVNEYRNMYRYKLEGFDAHRSQPTYSSYVRYTNLPTGSYSLIAESMNRDGIWSEEPAIFEFEILPAWWEFYWFRMLSGFFILLLIIGISRLRSAAIRARGRKLQIEVDRQTAVIQVHVDELARQTAQLKKLAITDDLTKLYNRRFFFQAFMHEWSRQKRFQKPISIVLFDIDNFKSFNDTYGHAIGDEVLIRVAEQMQLLVREIDILARYGGEEFIILMPETDIRDAFQAANRIRERISEIKIEFSSYVDLKVEVSGGISCKIPEEGALNPDGLIQQADIALYKAKRAGKNCIEIYTR